MKLVYQHLKVKAETPGKTADLLSFHTQEVEGISHQGVKSSGVVTGKILNVKPHPNADKLRIIEVDLGKTKLDIVTGAPNVAEGQIVPVAPVGARVRAVDHHSENQSPIIEDILITIKPVKLRGIESLGMVCGPDELGLSDSPTMGVHIFPNDTEIGVPVEKVIPSIDIIETDDKGTAHRPDLLSYLGIEIELAAILNKPYTVEKVPTFKAVKPDQLKISVQDKTKCPLFCVATIENMKNFFSPDWLVKFLTDNEVKSINLPTDVTNFIMLREGTSTHAFDKDCVGGKEMIVRAAKTGEKITTLDHKTYTLSDDDLTIADGKKPLDIAGIIGGADTAVKPDSKAIILTAAAFDGATIRRTSRRIGLRTDASARFERGTSRTSVIYGFSKALEMLVELSGGQITFMNSVGSATTDQIDINLDPEAVNSFLGSEIPPIQIKKLLERLKYEVKLASTGLKVTVPWWRTDVHLAADLCDDIARLKGFDSIEPKLPFLQPNNATSWPIFSTLNAIRQTAAAYWYEVETESMVPEKYEHSLEIQNPIGNKRFMRQNITDSLLKLVRHNLKEGYQDFGCFEIGAVTKYKESYHFAAAVAAQPDQLKSRLGVVLHHLHLHLPDLSFLPSNNINASDIKHRGSTLGQFCVTHLANKTVSFFEIDLEALSLARSARPSYKTYSAYPQVKRDIAFVINKKYPLNEVITTIKTCNHLITSVLLFDRFSGKSMAVGEQSLAFHLTFQSPERTLVDAEVDETMDKITEQLKTKFGAKVR